MGGVGRRQPEARRVFPGSARPRRGASRAPPFPLTSFVRAPPRPSTRFGSWLVLPGRVRGCEYAGCATDPELPAVGSASLSLSLFLPPRAAKTSPWAPLFALWFPCTPPAHLWRDAQPWPLGMLRPALVSQCLSWAQGPRPRSPANRTDGRPRLRGLFLGHRFAVLLGTLPWGWPS